MSWLETDHYIAPLYSFMRRKGLGGPRGADVYIIKANGVDVYAGKTLQGVYYRLWQHAKTASNLGAWLIEHEFDVDAASYQVEVIGVWGDIDEAEQHTITTREPLLNIVSYKNKLALPPSVRHPVEFINLEDVPSYVSSAGLCRYLGKELAEGIEESRAMASIYRRAYRDPNHPENRAMAVADRTCTTPDVFYYLRTRRLLDNADQP